MHAKDIQDRILKRENQIKIEPLGISNMRFQSELHYQEEIQKYEGYRDLLRQATDKQ